MTIHSDDANPPDTEAEQRLEQGWQDLLERLDTEAGDEELAAAERALATVPQRRGVSRWLAAAVALVGLNGVTLAVGAGAIGVVVTSVVIWKEQHHSHETMPFAMAIEILMRSDRGDEERASAVGQTFRRVSAASKALLRACADPHADVSSMANAGLQELRALAAGTLTSTVQPVTDQVLTDVLVIQDANAAPEARVAAMQRTMPVVRSGIAAMHAMPSLGDNADLARASVLKKLATGNLR
jgi:hypothetical protein